LNLGFGLPHVGAVASGSNIREVALEAERFDYHAIWTLDRLLRPTVPRSRYLPAKDGILPPQYGRVFEHLTVLTYVAALTERVRLGVGVLNLPLFHPAILARRVATLDHLSGGRVDLGVGAGWSAEEFDALGVPFERRGRMVEEYIEALTALWGEDPVEYQGTFFKVQSAEYGPKPVQKPHPPIYVGAFHPKALRRGGRLGDGFIGCCAPAASLLSAWDLMAEAAAEKGRPAPPAVVRFNVELSSRPLREEGRNVGVGSWDQLREDVLTLREAGVDEVFFDLSFEPTNTDLAATLSFLERFRTILD
jgi:probable F420-dependent oxidoreductase